MTTNTQNVLNRLERNPFYIYAETAFSHEGNLDYLYRLVDQVSLAQADGIKFQILMDPDESYTPEVRNGNDVLTWIFDADEWKKLLSYAHEKALDVVLLPIDLKATKFCAENTALYDFLEIHSINFNCRPLLEMADKIDKLLILGTGGRNLSDIEYALQILNRAYLEKRIIMMHGFQAFPSKKEDLRLGRIGKYQQLFDVKVGYADHTAHNSDDITMFQFAYLNGARIF